MLHGSNGWKADIRVTTVGPMKLRAPALAIICSSMAACGAKSATNSISPLFSIHARYLEAAPTVVFITVDNSSPDYLCVASADVSLGSGLIAVMPASENELFENRPPPDRIGGRASHPTKQKT